MVRASKGEVKVIVSNDRLQLRFSYAGERYYLSIGLRDNVTNRKVAKSKALQIELDMISGNFDPTLVKYKTAAQLKPKSVAISEKRSSVTVSLNRIWLLFTEYKRTQLSPNTIRNGYDVFGRYIQKLPIDDPMQATAIRDYALANFPLNATKRFLTSLSACCDWAVESGLLDKNAFSGMAAKIRIPKTETADIDPFSLEERDAIIDAFANDIFTPRFSPVQHSYYTDFIRFLFATGCRPAEAIALEWRNISTDYRLITFEQVVIDTDTGKRVRQGLKTQDRRRFPCNDSLHNLLKSRVRTSVLVFPSPTGKHIVLGNLRSRIWKPILAGLEIEYRKIYQTRHTFITRALETGKIDVKDLARLVGNSPEMIYRHYAGIKRELIVPEF